MIEGQSLLTSLNQRANQVKTPDEVSELMVPINKYVELGKPAQEERMKQISELSLQLYGKWPLFGSPEKITVKAPLTHLAFRKLNHLWLHGAFNSIHVYPFGIS